MTAAATSTSHDGCSCPLGGGCKHCVATLVAARRQAGPPATSPSAGEWRRALADLTTDDPDDDRPPTGVALQLVVQHPPRTRYAADTGPRVTIRPLRRGRSGKWIKTGASWQDVESPYSRDLADVDPHQRAALRALMASGRLDHYYGSSQAVPLDTFGPDLWHQLDRAIDVGVEARRRATRPRGRAVRHPARACVDLTEDETGVVTLTTGFVLDDEPLALVDGAQRAHRPTRSRPMGLRTVAALQLVPFDAPLHPTLARLVTTGALTVPAPDVDELLDVFQPALAASPRSSSPPTAA